jgi:hypothetical protein
LSNVLGPGHPRHRGEPEPVCSRISQAVTKEHALGDDGLIVGLCGGNRRRHAAGQRERIALALRASDRASFSQFIKVRSSPDLVKIITDDFLLALFG